MLDESLAELIFISCKYKYVKIAVGGGAAAVFFFRRT
jgi:hypothetical protein